MLYKVIVFAPLIGALIAGLLGRRIGDFAAQLVTTSLLFLSAILSWFAFISISGSGGEVLSVPVLRWMDVGNVQAMWAFKIDALTAVMLVVVTTVASLVHLYSWGYMKEDPSRARFFAYLSLFTFAMLMLVTADNFVQLFFGWEGVGLASYLLIGFWFKKPTANAAAIKAFVTNRVGDVGLALGVMTIYLVFGSVNYDVVFGAIAENADRRLDFLGMNFGAMELIAGLLFIGAMGKSAQFILHVWLPDAMEGPTPVSALIHAATMVTAGVFLVCRAYPIYEAAPVVSGFIAVLGGFTAFFAATVGLVQNDIKRVIAYSTCSQLGYMFFVAGLGVYSAGMFHLFTHAFFKALLFLGAGSVIHALHHEQDMRKMGGVWRKIPLTYTAMILGTLALMGFGIPGLGGFAGFYSKDAIIEAAYMGGQAGSTAAIFAFWAGIIAALMTSFYSWRLIFMTFHGRYRGDQHTFDHAHESPLSMLVPLLVLSIGAVLAGIVFYGMFLGDSASAFWGNALPGGFKPENIPGWVLWAPMFVGALGFVIAWFMYIYKNGVEKRIASEGGVLYNFLLNKWYIDEFYDFALVRPLRKIGDLFWKIGDVKIIDGLGPNGVAATVLASSKRLGKVQSGYLYHYAFVMLLGVAGLIAFVFVGSGG